MCFITYWTGYSTDLKMPSKLKRKAAKGKLTNKDIISEFYEVIPIHKRPDLIDEAIQLINSEWPKTRCQRLWSLGSSSNELPTSLIVTFKSEEHISFDEFAGDRSTVCEAKIINDIFFNQEEKDAQIYEKTGKPIMVLGHLRLLPVPADPKACFIESMVISKDYRGKGIGTFLIEAAEKYCEEVLKLRTIYMSTYDSGEFYMKMGYAICEAISIFGNGEINLTTKKLFLKKALEYEELEIEEEIEDDVYDPNKDNNYRQQCQISNDVIISGLPYKLEYDKIFMHRVCILFSIAHSLIKYFYSFEHVNREKETRSVHFIISFNSKEAQQNFLRKVADFGTLCYQQFWDKPVDECDNVILKVFERLTNMNLTVLKELKNLKEEGIISGWIFNNCSFSAKQNDNLVTVSNMAILELFRMRDQPSVVKEESIGWEISPEVEDVYVSPLEKFKQNFRKLSIKPEDTEIVVPKYKSFEELESAYGYDLESSEDESSSEEEEMTLEEYANAYRRLSKEHTRNYESDEEPWSLRENLTDENCNHDKRLDKESSQESSKCSIDMEQDYSQISDNFVEKTYLQLELTTIEKGTSSYPLKKSLVHS